MSSIRTAQVLGALLLGATLLGAPAPTRAATTITVTTTVDELTTDGDCALREAVRAANLDQAIDACPAGSGADTISLPAGTYALTLTGNDEDAALTGDLDITADLTISGAGAGATIIDGSAGEGLLDVFGSTGLTLTGLTGQNASLWNTVSVRGTMGATRCVWSAATRSITTASIG